MTAAVPIPDDVLETAVIWRQRIGQPEWDARADADLEVWLQADERHALAFAQAGALFDFFDHNATAPEMIAVRKALLGRVQALMRRRALGSGLGMPSRRLAAALAGVAVLAGVGAYPLAVRGDVYQTDRGERRLVTLDDGSRVSLDADTRLQVRYTRDARRLKLIRGQARFDVAKDASRPFSVRAKDRTVVATGTAFNIDVLAPRVKVTLIEGRVLILPADKSAKAVELRPGQQLVAPNDAPPKVVAVADLEEATAWQRGKLMFDQEPLADAVAKVNRYGAREVSVNPAVAAVPVSGVFEAGDTNGFLEAISGFLPVSVVDGRSGVTIEPVEGRG